MMKIFLYLILLRKIYSYVLIKPAFLAGPSVGREDYYSFQLHASVVDADFERVDESNNGNNEIPTNSKGANDPKYPRVFEKNTMLDLTLLDNNETFAFLDPESQNVIPCKLAVTAKLDVDSGKTQTYAVGVPAENGVLLTLERGDEVDILDPDDEENLEFLETMAGALQKEISSDLQLAKTPRILTIIGDLDQHIDEFNNNLDNLVDDESMSVENLLKTMDETSGDDDDLDSVFDFFKKEFGSAQYNEFMKEFETGQDDPEFVAFSELFDTDINDDTDAPKSPSEFEKTVRSLGDDFQDEGVGIKIVGYAIKQDNHPIDPPHVYSLVKPVKPLTVVGRLAEKPGTKETVFELLSQEEELMVVPKIEQTCEEDMKKLGVELKNFKSTGTVSP